MNIGEYQALFSDSSISDRERTLYLYLRWHMDFTTGIVGRARRISYQAIREHLEFTPAIGSKEPAVRISRDQVNRLLRKLERYGWIEALHDKRGPREAMVFKLVLASTNKIRPNEERHTSATMGATRGAPRENTSKTSCSGDSSATMSATGAPQDERHTSDTSDQDLSLTRESLNSLSADEVKLTKQLILTARSMCGFKGSDDELRDVFAVFISHKSNRNKVQSDSDWLGDWRNWIARENRYERKYERHQRSNQQHGTPNKNATASVLHFARQAAEREA